MNGVIWSNVQLDSMITQSYRSLVTMIIQRVAPGHARRLTVKVNKQKT